MQANIEEQEIKSMKRNSPILFAQNATSEKHILRIKYLLQKLDTQRILYPKGLVSQVQTASSASNDPRPLKRIELFAKNDRSDETFGVIRNFFVGFSSERGLLDLANVSNNVICVRSVPSSGEGGRRNKKILEDKLVLKRIDEDEEEQDSSFRRMNPFSSANIVRRQKLPKIIVSPRWLDKMQLENGDRIIVSNPIENYLAPPPDLAGV